MSGEQIVLFEEALQLFAPMRQRAIALAFGKGVRFIDLIVSFHFHRGQLDRADRLPLAIHHQEQIAGLRDPFAVRLEQVAVLVPLRINCTTSSACCSVSPNAQRSRCSYFCGIAVAMIIPFGKMPQCRQDSTTYCRPSAPVAGATAHSATAVFTRFYRSSLCLSRCGAHTVNIIHPMASARR